MISENILALRRRIAAVCSGINKPTSSVIVVAVSKGRAVEQIKQAVDCGIADIGENRVQEAFLKYNILRPNTYDLRPIRWHMVGHLQTNKVKEAVRIFDLIQSVDSLRLAGEIDKEAAKIGKVQEILIEVKTSPEETKSGVRPPEVIKLMEAMQGLKNISVRGLMTIAPIVSKPEDARPYFKMLRELKDKINASRAKGHELTILSMGMTDDFEVAIQEGANMVRLGRAIFEE